MDVESLFDRWFEVAKIHAASPTAKSADETAAGTVTLLQRLTTLMSREEHADAASVSHRLCNIFVTKSKFSKLLCHAGPTGKELVLSFGFLCIPLLRLVASNTNGTLGETSISTSSSALDCLTALLSVESTYLALDHNGPVASSLPSDQFDLSILCHLCCDCGRDEGIRHRLASLLHQLFALCPQARQRALNSSLLPTLAQDSLGFATFFLACHCACSVPAYLTLRSAAVETVCARLRGERGQGGGRQVYVTTHSRNGREGDACVGPVTACTGWVWEEPSPLAVSLLEGVAHGYEEWCTAGGGRGTTSSWLVPLLGATDSFQVPLSALAGAQLASPLPLPLTHAECAPSSSWAIVRDDGLQGEAGAPRHAWTGPWPGPPHAVGAGGEGLERSAAWLDVARTAVEGEGDRLDTLLWPILARPTLRSLETAAALTPHLVPDSTGREGGAARATACRAAWCAVLLPCLSVLIRGFPPSPSARQEEQAVIDVLREGAAAWYERVSGSGGPGLGAQGMAIHPGASLGSAFLEALSCALGKGYGDADRVPELAARVCRVHAEDGSAQWAARYLFGMSPTLAGVSATVRTSLWAAGLISQQGMEGDPCMLCVQTEEAAVTPPSSWLAQLLLTLTPVPTNPLSLALLIALCTEDHAAHALGRSAVPLALQAWATALADWAEAAGDRAGGYMHAMDSGRSVLRVCRALCTAAWPTGGDEAGTGQGLYGHCTLRQSQGSMVHACARAAVALALPILKEAQHVQEGAGLTPHGRTGQEQGLEVVMLAASLVDCALACLAGLRREETGQAHGGGGVYTVCPPSALPLPAHLLSKALLLAGGPYAAPFRANLALACPEALACDPHPDVRCAALLEMNDRLRFAGVYAAIRTGGPSPHTADPLAAAAYCLLLLQSVPVLEGGDRVCDNPDTPLLHALATDGSRAIDAMLALCDGLAYSVCAGHAIGASPSRMQPLVARLRQGLAQGHAPGGLSLVSPCLDLEVTHGPNPNLVSPCLDLEVTHGPNPNLVSPCLDLEVTHGSLLRAGAMPLAASCLDAMYPTPGPFSLSLPGSVRIPLMHSVLARLAQCVHASRQGDGRDEANPACVATVQAMAGRLSPEDVCAWLVTGGEKVGLVPAICRAVCPQFGGLVDAAFVLMRQSAAQAQPPQQHQQGYLNIGYGIPVFSALPVHGAGDARGVYSQLVMGEGGGRDGECLPLLSDDGPVSVEMVRVHGLPVQGTPVQVVTACKPEQVQAYAPLASPMSLDRHGEGIPPATPEILFVSHAVPPVIPTGMPVMVQDVCGADSVSEAREAVRV